MDTSFYEKKALDDLIICTDSEKDYLTLAEIQQYLPISRIACGRYMNELSKKSPGICGKATIITKDDRRIVSYFGFKLKDNHGLPLLRQEQVKEVARNENQDTGIELSKCELELEHQDFEGRDIQKTEPKSEKFICDDRLLHLIMYKGYKMGIPKEVYLRNKCYSQGKGWLIVDKYIIRDGDGNMSQLESTDPKFIQKIHGNAMNGVY